MADNTNTNGFLRASNLVSILVPIIGVMSGSIYLFVSLTIAPLQRQIDTLAAHETYVDAQLVPRAEHNRDWDAIDKHFLEMQRQIDQNREDLKDIYRPSDAMKNYDQRLQRLEDSLRNQRH